MLLDVVQGIPAAALVRLGPGDHFSQQAHVLLLQVRTVGTRFYTAGSVSASTHTCCCSKDCM